MLVLLKSKFYISYLSSNSNSYIIIFRSAENHYVGADNLIITSTKKERTKPITCVWVNGVVDSVTDEYLESHFSQFGPIKKCLIDRLNKCALLCFQQVNVDINIRNVFLLIYILLQSSFKKLIFAPKLTPGIT